MTCWRPRRSHIPGATHAGSFDLTYLCCLPDVVVMAPSNEAGLAKMVFTSSNYNQGPIFCRYPRGEGVGVEIPNSLSDIEIGKGQIIHQGTGIAILSLGTRLSAALKVRDMLKVEGCSITVADARFAKPIDEDLLIKLWNEHEKLIIIEEGSVGGFSSHCLHFLSSGGYLNQSGKEIRCLNMQDKFLDHASQTEQLAKAGLDVNGLLNIINDMVPFSNLNNKVVLS